MLEAPIPTPINIIILSHSPIDARVFARILSQDKSQPVTIIPHLTIDSALSHPDPSQITEAMIEANLGAPSAEFNFLESRELKRFFDTFPNIAKVVLFSGNMLEADPRNHHHLKHFLETTLPEREIQVQVRCMGKQLSPTIKQYLLGDPDARSATPKSFALTRDAVREWKLSPSPPPSSSTCFLKFEFIENLRRSLSPIRSREGVRF
jgi:hypothetical protein